MAIYNYSRHQIKKKMKWYRKGRVRTQRWHSIRSMIVITFIGLLCTAAGTGVGFAKGAYDSIIDQSPSLERIDAKVSYASYIYNAAGEVTSKLMATDSSTIPVTSDKIPSRLKQAFIAIEDRRFYTHHGVDYYGILRAVAIGLKTKDFSQGASTITQQYIKNSVFDNWVYETPIQSIERKLQEQHLALELESEESKDEILTDYLNIINLGHGTYGVQAASQTYFNKDVSDLTVSECAVLAAITQNPTKYDPINNPEENKKRRKEVLNGMLEQQYITQQEYQEAIADDVYAEIAQATAERNAEVKTVNSYFDDELIRQVVSDLEDEGYSEAKAYSLLYTGGLKIYSTQNAEIQQAADKAANNPDNYPCTTKYYPEYALSISNSDGTVSNYSTQTMQAWRMKQGKGPSMLFKSEESARNAATAYKEALLKNGGEVIAETFTAVLEPQVSMTITDQRTGNVLAIVGGRGEKDANLTLDRASQSLRQPGSTFKIVAAYAPAINECGMRLDTIYTDEEYHYKSGQKVRNWYGEAYRGDVTIRQAIENSMNIIAVKTITDVTPSLAYDYLLKFGFTSLVDNEEINGKIYSDIQQTLALGGLTKGVSNLELNAAYATIANGGFYIEPKFYTKVIDHNGNVLLDTTDRTEEYVLKDSTAYLLTSAMEGVVKEGTGKACKISETPVAGKTGTTSDENDVWFAGYSNYYTCTVWAGNDENTNLKSKQAKIAQKVWHEAMENIHKGLAKSEFEVPSSVVKLTICKDTGKIAVKNVCEDTYDEYYARDNCPTEYCSREEHGLPEAVKRPTSSSDELSNSPQNTEQINQQNTEDTSSAEKNEDINQPTEQANSGVSRDVEEESQSDSGSSAQNENTEPQNTEGNANAQQGQQTSTTPSVSRDDAQAAVDRADSALQSAASVLEQAKANLANAQADGDASIIEQAQQQYDDAESAYNNAVNAYQQATQVLQQAK